MTNAKRELERIIDNYTMLPTYKLEEISQAIIDAGFVRLEDVEIEKEIAEIQEVADDKEASPEIRSNANSYIWGMKKAIAIASAKPIRVVK